MKLKLLAIILPLAFSICATAQESVTLDNGRVVSVRQAYGQDQPYPFDLEEAVPEAPDGYEPFYIEHYGRHGSRFAYNNKYYDIAKKAFDQAAAADALTESGAAVKADFDRHYATYHLRMGDLSDAGWNQQQRLGREMVESYPAIFSDDEAAVVAVSSDSRRSMMSMSAFCIGMAQAAPALKIRADQGSAFQYATQPKGKSNPFLEEWPERTFPFEETENEFCLRKTGNCPQLLERLFTNPDVALEGIGRERFIRHLYVLVAGMASLNPEDRTDFTGAFTPQEFVKMWEVDDYQRFHEYYAYKEKTAPVALSMLDDADEAISGNRRGVSLRFGHDHVVLPLLVLLRLNGYTREPATPDEVSSIYANIDCPMAGNVQMVFYRSDINPEILVNIRLNGRNATVDGMQEVCKGFYCWEDYRKAVLSSMEAPLSKSLDELEPRILL